MNEMFSVLTIIASLSVSALLITIIVSFFVYKKEGIKSNAGIFLLDIDLNNNRMRKSNLFPMIEKDYKKNKNLEYFQEGWMDINVFLSGISEDNREKFLNGLDALRINKKYVKFIIKNKSLEETEDSIQWIVEFFQSKEEGVTATIEWSYVKNIPNGLKVITKDELFKEPHTYKTFIAFNLKSKDPNDFKDFIVLLYENLKIKDINFFVSKNIIILIVFGNSSKEIEIKVKEIITKIEKIKINRKLIYYYDAIGIVECKSVNDSKDLLKIMNRIYFSLIKSLQLNKVFQFNMKNIFFNEFEEFKENYLLLNNIIKGQKIESMEIPILDKNLKAVIAKYIKPNLNFPNNFWIDMILKNKNILPNIEDIYFNQMLNSLDKLDHYLIDVNDYIVLQNIEKIENLSSMLFMITFLDSTNIRNLELITETLKTRGIKFGIRIEKIVPEIITLIESIVPHAIIIGQNLLNSSNLKDFLNLKQLIILCQKNPATLIFENPSNFELSNKFVNYYYKNDNQIVKN